jgi:hypothetical protein
LLLAGDRSFVDVGVGHDDWCVIRGGEGRLQRRGRRGWPPECGGLHSLCSESWHVRLKIVCCVTLGFIQTVESGECSL